MRGISTFLFIAFAISLTCIDVARGQLGTVFGKEEFLNSCASCHGETGKGDGPLASFLTKAPADLTLLAKKNGGVFPSALVYDLIDGRSQVLVHGSREMPVWGERYKRDLKSRMPQEKGSYDLPELMVHSRIRMLTEYLNSLQEK